MLDVLIIGAGPCGLYAADRLSQEGFHVTVVDRMPSPARKFLMAGRGGLNLTHGEDLDRFLGRYRQAEVFLAPMIRDFPPAALRTWCHGLGEDTFVGSSGRVFPKSMKASPLLRSWLRQLGENGVTLLLRHRLAGFDTDGTPLLQAENRAPRRVEARAVLLALGGASWPKLGSDAAWVPLLESKGIAVNRFQPANCGFLIDWSPYLRDRFAGSPLKRIALSFAGRTVPGEAVISEKGLEGGAVYALSAEIRDAIDQQGSADLRLDLRPGLSAGEIEDRLARPRGKQSNATFLKKALKLAPVEQALLREAGPLPSGPADLAKRIKALPLTCSAPYGIERAISSAGGIRLEEVETSLMLKKLPGVFAAGEMLAWEAPTGGYLLQACFATAHRAAAGIADYLKTGTGRQSQ
ncbi:TIGR03862 family flavoprotein [Roseibium aggregatum]|uniref:TIGR03862 family flavoprotein n=1 Tax=Roseibium aggregatum TaxID=187304 RepID=A0A939E8Q9_9HYPH|nr:TIGR03862 family flavoprotein [Roseibium aggregatum]MBN9668941.1 TIGR03862 family flavoprotein [Roseibium aggregatum]